MPRRPALSQETAEHLRRLHKAGKLIKEIAAEFGISHRTAQDAVSGKGTYSGARPCHTCACCRYYASRQ